MGIMGFIKKFAENKKAKGAKFKQMQEDDRLETMLEERKKSANQRELEKHFEEQNEARIKDALTKVRNQRNKDSWKGGLLKGGKNLLHEDKSVMNDGNSILKQKNIFKNEKNIFNNKNIFNDDKVNNPVDGKRMFFK